MAILLKAIYRFDEMPSKIIHKPQKNSTQLHMEKSKNQGQQKQFCTIKELLEASQSLTSNYTTELQNWNQPGIDKQEDQWNWIEDPDINPHIFKHLVIDKETKKISNGKKQAYLTSGAGITGYQHVEEWK